MGEEGGVLPDSNTEQNDTTDTVEGTIEDAVQDADVDASPVEDDDDGALTYDQYIEQQKQKQVAEDQQRELRSVVDVSNDKQFRKVAEVTTQKNKLPANLQFTKDSTAANSDAHQTSTNKSNKQNKSISLTEFVGPDARLRPIRDNTQNDRSRGNTEFRGRGGRGRGNSEYRGGDREQRGGRGNGEYRSRGNGEYRGRGGRGGSRGGLNVNDDDAFPTLGSQ